jgi:3-polyprenyl-4-hydroxybenzoate decarboxylase
MLGAQAFGANESEFDVAGGIMGRAVELTDAEYVRLPIPANAELVIEGVLHPGDLEPEGPLGEFTGYYGRERSPQPVIEVKGTPFAPVAHPYCRIDGEISVLRDRHLLCHHALCPHSR